MKTLIQYTKERFPIIPAMLFSFLFSFTGISYVNNNFENKIIEIILASVILSLFLFRIRLWDEIKDFEFDQAHHKNRPVSRGLITLAAIKRLSLLILFAEIIIQSYFPRYAIVILTITILYSFLMFNNFFIKKIEKNIFAYLFSHQIIFFFYIYYTLSIGSSDYFIFKNQSDYWMVLAIFLPPLIYEVGRKCKHRVSPEGYFTSDTYIYKLGADKCFLFLISLFYLQSLLIFMIFGTGYLFMLYLAATIAITFLYPMFKQGIINTSNKWSLALGFYGLIILSIYTVI